MATIGFIPVRGGSKSIPLKNIKLFCGKPLIYWTVKSMVESYEIDRVVVATDSNEIENTVREFNFSEITIYRRSDENAQDHSSTESVILEYIESSGLQKENIFILAQATSPFTTSGIITKALQYYYNNAFTSVLTAVKVKHFYWDDNGKSINYDYKNRPRRQDFTGMNQENGALYISTVGSIIKDKNRLSENIGIYLMPEYTTYEIDEPDDWIIAELLMKKYILDK